MDPQTAVSDRPRTHSRSFSLHSSKSADKTTNQELAEKARRDSFLRGESKANPNAAINELQPQSMFYPRSCHFSPTTWFSLT